LLSILFKEVSEGGLVLVVKVVMEEKVEHREKADEEAAAVPYDLMAQLPTMVRRANLANLAKRAELALVVGMDCLAIVTSLN
jgi:hypothetical protein